MPINTFNGDFDWMPFLNFSIFTCLANIKTIICNYGSLQNKGFLFQPSPSLIISRYLK